MKKREIIAFRADTGFCDDLDRARGSRSRSAFVREIVTAGMRLREGSLEPWIGKGGRRDPLLPGGAVGGDRAGL